MLSFRFTVAWTLFLFYSCSSERERKPGIHSFCNLGRHCGAFTSQGREETKYDQPRVVEKCKMYRPMGFALKPQNVPLLTNIDVCT